MAARPRASVSECRARADLDRNFVATNISLFGVLLLGTPRTVGRTNARHRHRRHRQQTLVTGSCAGVNAPPPPHPSVSVIISCYREDRFELLLAAIDSVLAQTSPPNELIVVVDH